MVDMTVSEQDWMMKGSETRAIYFTVGRSALDLILGSFGAAGLDPALVESILDFGCGHGRVLRFLRDRFPAARIVACDSNRDAVEFCARTFGAEPLYSGTGFDEPRDGRYDLIWAGSVVTHTSEADWHALMDTLTARCGGLLAFTTAGATVVDLIANGEHRGLDPAAAERLVADYRTGGFGYADYPYAPEQGRRWGRAAVTPDWVFGAMEKYPFRCVLMTECGWAGRQDVYAWVPC